MFKLGVMAENLAIGFNTVSSLGAYIPVIYVFSLRNKTLRASIF
ncbi:MAG: hypothetical protein ACI89T_001268 [Cognaticolwellia sp.]|jgi:hypothetical protein